MFCSKCGKPNSEGVNFCRNCGTDLDTSLLASVNQNSQLNKNIDQSLMKGEAKDPDELTGKGIGSVIIGDGFFMVAVILSATHSSVSSLLWLFLLIPAFFFFGKGFSDVLHARQIRRRQKKQNSLTETLKAGELPSSKSIADVIKKSISGELTPVPSIAERTTRNLK